jgi:hypothetical protein
MRPSGKIRLMAGAAGPGGAAGAGTLATAGGGGEFVPYFGATGAHQFFHLGLAAVGALDLGVAAEDQFFKVLVAAIAVKLENGHCEKSPLDHSYV